MDFMLLEMPFAILLYSHKHERKKRMLGTAISSIVLSVPRQYYGRASGNAIVKTLVMLLSKRVSVNGVMYVRMFPSCFCQNWYVQSVMANSCFRNLVQLLDR